MPVSVKKDQAPAGCPPLQPMLKPQAAPVQQATVSVGERSVV